MANKITKAELEQLQGNLKEYQDKLKDARERLVISKKQGDLSENAEYDSAVNDIEMYTNVIKGINAKLAAVELVESWSFVLEMTTHDNKTIQFKTVLGEMDTVPFDIGALSSDKTSIFNSGTSVFELGVNTGIVTKRSKLGSNLVKYTANPDTAINSTFSYVDNRQHKLTFKILDIKKE